jgi:hypothetical protein
VLVGGSPDNPDDVVVRKALLATLTGPSPVFLNRDSNAWVYDGLSLFRNLIEDRRRLEERKRPERKTLNRDSDRRWEAPDDVQI